MTASPGPTCLDREALEDHFFSHGHDLGLRTVAAYEQSSLETVEVGSSFSYRDRSTGAWRIGYYDRWTARFTAVDEDGEEIVSDYRCTEQYVQNLLESDYR